MAAVIIGDMVNLYLSSNKENLCGMKDTIESLFTLYLVCWILLKKKEK